MDPVTADAVEETLLCRVDVLCRLSNEAALVGLGPVGGPRPVPLPRTSGFDVLVFIVPAERFPPITLLSVPLDRSKLKSFDADEMLLCRSSKLGEGRNSYDPPRFSSAACFPPKEKRE